VARATRFALAVAALAVAPDALVAADFGEIDLVSGQVTIQTQEGRSERHERRD
jgi:hypothetical protein